MPATMSSSLGSSADILKILTRDTEATVARIQDKKGVLSEFQHTVDDLEKKFAKDKVSVDESALKTRKRVMEATFESLRKEIAQEEEDLAKAVAGLHVFLDKLGQDYEKLGEPSEQEKARIKAAEQAVKVAEGVLASKASIRFFKESRTQAAKATLAQANSQLEQLKENTRKNVRERLMKADIEQTLQEFTTRVQKTIGIMENRVRDINGQLASVVAQKGRAFKIKEEAAKALERFQTDLTLEETNLREAQERLAQLTHGSQDYASQEEKVSDLRATTEELRGKYNIALTLHESKEKFAQALEVHERTQTQLRDNQFMWITSLKSDTEERLVTFRSYIEARKAASDQEVAKNLDDLGSEIDQRQVSALATIGAVSERHRLERQEKVPGRIKAIFEVRAAQAESDAAVRQREKRLAQDFMDNYGIDIKQSSFFSYIEEKTTGA